RPGKHVMGFGFLGAACPFQANLCIPHSICEGAGGTNEVVSISGLRQVLSLLLQECLCAANRPRNVPGQPPSDFCGPIAPGRICPEHGWLGALLLGESPERLNPILDNVVINRPG